MRFWRWSLAVVGFVAILALVGSSLRVAGGDKDKAGKDKDTKEAKDKEGKDTPAKDKDAAAKDKDAGAKDKDAGAKDKDAAAKDKDAGAKDKKDAPAKDKDAPVKDKDAGAKDKDKEVKVEEYKWEAFNRKDPFYQTLETTTNQELAVMEQKIKQTQKQKFFVQWTPKEKKDGTWIVEQKILGMQMSIDIGGNKISYDSTAEKIPANPMSDFFNNLKNATLTYHINSKMEIEKVEGRDGLISKLSATNPQMKTLLETLLSDEALKQMAQPTWGALPPADRKDNKWEKKVKLNLGNIGSYESELKYSIKDKTTIDISSTLKYTPPQKDGKGPRLPFIIKEADTTKMEATGTGTAIWDDKNGWFSKVEMKTNIKNLKLTIEVGTVDTQVTINQDQTSIVQTSDQNPLAPAKTPEKK